MSEPIGPGDWVECIDNGTRIGYNGGQLGPCPELVLGQKYQIKEMFPTYFGVAVRLVGVVNPRGGRIQDGMTTRGYNPDRFRKITDRGDFLEALMSKTLNTEGPVRKVVRA